MISKVNGKTEISLYLADVLPVAFSYTFEPFTPSNLFDPRLELTARAESFHPRKGSMPAKAEPDPA